MLERGGFAKYVGGIRKMQLDPKTVNITTYSFHREFGFLAKPAILGSVDQSQCLVVRIGYSPRPLKFEDD